MVEDSDPLSESQTLLSRVRRGGETAPARRSLQTWDASDLTALSQPERRATWLNVYNAIAQLELAADPDRLRGAISRLLFFARDRVSLAGRELSLNDIEHGYLRGQASWGLGYVPRLFPSQFERAVRVPLDPRIHFALNCGAASCPPIETYSADVGRELDLGTKSYLESTVTYDQQAAEVHVPKVFSWYRGDFGGTDGIRQFLQQYGCVPEESDPRIRYKSYDWSPSLGAFGGSEEVGWESNVSSEE